MHTSFPRRALQLLLWLVVVNLIGCANTKITVQQPYRDANADEKIIYAIKPLSRMNDAALEIFSQRLDEQLTDAGRQGTRETATLEMDIRIVGYAMRDGATRVMAGALAGSDKIESIVFLRTLVDRRVVAEFTVTSSNKTTTGSARTLIEAHADKLVNYVLHQKK